MQMNQPSRLPSVRVLFLDHVARMSGAEQSLADLVAGLAHGPVEPVVVLPEDGPLSAELRAQGILVRKVPMSKRMLETSRTTLARKPLVAVTQLFAFLVAGARLFRLIREVKPHIVHTNTLKTHLLAILPCKAAGVPLVWHMRDILPKGWLLRAFTVCARFTSAIVVPSRAVAEPFKGQRTIFRRLRLVPNGIRVKDFQDARRDRSLREMMGVGANDLVVGIIGRIAPWKGQDVFLRAAAMLAQRHPRAHFTVIGDALFPEKDVPFFQALQRLAIQMGIEDRVSFLGWQPAPEAMAAIDVFVHASLEPEPFGRAIVEAMASGKPVVAAAGGATHEIVPPAAGVIVPPGRPELLADALDRILSDRKLRKRMGEAGAAIADSFFPVQRTVQSVAQIYRHLAPRARRRRVHIPALARMQAKRAAHARKQAAFDQPMGMPTPNIEMQPPPRRSAPRPPHAGGQGAIATRRVPAEPQQRVRIDDEPAPEAPAHAVPVRRPKPKPVSGAQATAVAAMPLASPSITHAPATLFAPLRVEPFVQKPGYDLCKRALDLALGLAIIVLGLPLWLFIAIMIKLESPGPVFFRGVVYGKHCAPITYFKFRSMRIDGDDRAHRRFIERYVRENGGHEVDGEVVYKLLGDERITAVGRWIRKFSLDEIPQIINVLRGEMSFVGPRPPLDYEYELYNDIAKQRLQVLPGITGMQQVWSRDQCSFEQKLNLDMRYIRSRSVWLDLKLIAHTILAIPRGH